MNPETWMFGIPMFAYLFGYLFIISLACMTLLGFLLDTDWEFHVIASFFLASIMSATKIWVL